jgi:hypothetical protein
MTISRVRISVVLKSLLTFVGISIVGGVSVLKVQLELFPLHFEQRNDPQSGTGGVASRNTHGYDDTSGSYDVAPSNPGSYDVRRSRDAINYGGSGYGSSIDYGVK